MEGLYTVLILSVAAVNATSADTSSEAELAEATWYLAGATILIAIGTVAAIFIQIWWNRRIQRTEALLKIIEWLSTEDMRAHRREVFKEYCRCQSMNETLDFSLTEALREHADAVQSSFDKASVLVDRNLVDYKHFREIYSDMFLRSWVALKDDIDRRKKRNSQYGLSYRKVIARFEQDCLKTPGIDCSEFKNLPKAKTDSSKSI